MADGLRSLEPGQVPFPVVHQVARGILRVSEAEILQAIVGEDRPWVWLYEEPGRKRQHQIAMSDDATEERVGSSRFGIRVRAANRFLDDAIDDAGFQQIGRGELEGL